VHHPEDEVDALDRRILAELQGDGRQTNARLAETLGLSQSATHHRVRRLEQEGMIRGYRADVAPEGMDVGLQAFVAAELNAHSHSHIEDFERGIVHVPGVRACYHITGRFDYLVHVAVRDLGRLRALIKTDIASIPGVAKLETLLVLTEVKADAGWPEAGDDEERP
jgi:Lrp/AsnC family leucine-responsive transcriptional regulator